MSGFLVDAFPIPYLALFMVWKKKLACLVVKMRLRRMNTKIMRDERQKVASSDIRLTAEPRTKQVDEFLLH